MRLLTFLLRYAIRSVACSGDGMRMAAGSEGRSIYITLNGGKSWSYPDGLVEAEAYTGVAFSIDGTILVGARVYPGSDQKIFVSSYESRFNVWVRLQSTSQPWQSLGMSMDGATLLASDTSGNVFTARATTGWSGLEKLSLIPLPTFRQYKSVTPIGGLQSAYAVVPGGGVMSYSQPLEVSWDKNPFTSSLNNFKWASVVMAGDGIQLVAAARRPQGGGIYVSRDRGRSWLLSNAPTDPSVKWQQLVQSRDGVKLLAVTLGQGI